MLLRFGCTNNFNTPESSIASRTTCSAADNLPTFAPDLGAYASAQKRDLDDANGSMVVFSGGAVFVKVFI
jgi:hypothetical protein